MAQHLLIVDDDREICTLLSQFMTQHGYRVSVAHDGRGMMQNLESARIDLVVLDVMLPGESGLSLCRRVRSSATVPIIMLTAVGSETDRIVGLEMGADDYLAKPFEPRELLARLRSILRRARDDHRSEALQFGRLEIDAAAREVRLGGEPCALTSYQFALLLGLARHAGRVMSREALMDIVKNERFEAFDRSIDVHISRIRAAIEDDPKNPRRIITVRGAGYVFAKSQE
jgi:two-component system, OmpR family, phosphate regulon response regulator OmpR